MEIDVEDKLQAFILELLNNKPEYVLRKNIIFGDSFRLKNDLYYELKQEIATNFDVHPSCVFMVGSGKLGFSISEKNIIDKGTKKIIETKPRFRSFSDESDLDIAIVSPVLFNNYWRQVFKYSQQKPYWPKEKSFKKNMFEGWMRPDQLPPSVGKFQIQKNWFEYFSELTASGKYGDFTIAAGLYNDWEFLENYQLKSINECRISLEGNK